MTDDESQTNGTAGDQSPTDGAWSGAPAELQADTAVPAATVNGGPLLDIEHLRVLFPIKAGVIIDRKVGAVHAVDDVSFVLEKGETLGVVGESGCGKTTLIRALANLVPITSGAVRFSGADITNASRNALQPVRRQMQMVFQDPQASLNPRKRVLQILATPLKIRGVQRDRIESEARDLLTRVGLHAEHLNRFPHEFSGGQRQRIGIARALAVNPSLILLDEPVSALDVSIQAQVINLLDDLQHELHLSYLFVAHDLSVVRHVSDRIVVMYLGKLMEVSPAEELYLKPIHPYTSALLGSDPDLRPRGEPGPRAADRRRRAAEPDPSAVGMPLPHPLPARDGHLPFGRAAADRIRRRPSRRLPPPPARHRRGDRGVQALGAQPAVLRRTGA